MEGSIELLCLDFGSARCFSTELNSRPAKLKPVDCAVFKLKGMSVCKDKIQFQQRRKMMDSV